MNNHGMSKTAIYRAWSAMKDRCYNTKLPCYPNYGGRGIRVCYRWRNSFINFYEDMGDKPTPQHSLDRIDNYGHYIPSNCKWSTKQEQQLNRRPADSLLGVKYVYQGRKGFFVQIKRGRKAKYYGTWPTLETAIQYRDHILKEEYDESPTRRRFTRIRSSIWC